MDYMRGVKNIMWRASLRFHPPRLFRKRGCTPPSVAAARAARSEQLDRAWARGAQRPAARAQALWTGARDARCADVTLASAILRSAQVSFLGMSRCQFA